MGGVLCNCKMSALDKSFVCCLSVLAIVAFLVSVLTSAESLEGRAPRHTGGLTLELEAQSVEEYSEVDLRDLFNDYIKTYKITIPNGEASGRYFDNFSNSVRRILYLRAEALEGPQRDQYGLNVYAHLDINEVEELQKMRYAKANCGNEAYLNRLNREIDYEKQAAAGEWQLVNKLRRLDGATTPSDPAKFHYPRRMEKNLNLPPTDWPNSLVGHMNCLTPVRYQHPPLVDGCGSCWAHGTVGGVEIPLCVAKQITTEDERQALTDFGDEDPSQMLSLSVQEILDCTSVDNKTSSDVLTNHGCCGGEVFNALNVLFKTGLRKEADFGGEGDHYDADAHQRCAEREAMTEPEVYPRWAHGGGERRAESSTTNKKFKLAGYTAYPEIGEITWADRLDSAGVWPNNLTQHREWIKKHVRGKGAVVAAIQVVDEHFMAWKNWTDIYYPSVDECIGRVTTTGHVSDITNHLVPIVGYGQDAGRIFFWVKNSWTPSFGAGGYFKVAANHCDNFAGPLGLGLYFKTPLAVSLEELSS